MSDFWRPYVPVAQRREEAREEMDRLRKKGLEIQPVEISGRGIANSFWGKGWCDHLESFSDFSNRLPRGRTYVRNGSVCHLDVKAGKIEAYVSGSEVYRIAIDISPLPAAVWKTIKAQCRGQIGSILELLQGKLSTHVMTVVSDRKKGLFPRPGEIKMKCSCPDWATMCKHVAAVLYGVGSRLDTRPELLFLLRGVDAEELITADVALPTAATKDVIADSALSDIFGIDLDPGDAPKPAAKPGKSKAKARAAAKAPAAPTKAKKRAAKPIFDPKAPTGEAIARLRKQSGLTHAEFGRAVGASAQTVKNWESNPGALRIQNRHLTPLQRLQESLKEE